MSFAAYSLLPVLAVGVANFTFDTATAPLADTTLQSPLVQGASKKTANDDGTLILPLTRSSVNITPTITIVPAAPPSTSANKRRPGRNVLGGGRAPVVVPILPEPISQWIP